MCLLTESAYQSKEFHGAISNENRLLDRWHTDSDVISNTYKGNMSASNTTLCLFDYPELDENWKEDIPKLINGQR